MTSELQKSEKGKGLKWGIGICIFFACVFVVLGFGAGIYGYYALRAGGSQLSDLGNFGSYLQGTVASFWALAGVLLIFVAFLVQKQQLQYQREELELTRADLAEQENQIRRQNESIKRQNFENAFFHLLSLHNENVTQLSGTVGGVKVNGRACFVEWFNQIYQSDFPAWIKRHAGSDPASEKAAVDYYLDFYKTNRANFAHYFRTIYHIFKFVKFGELPVEDKKRYASLARAQLSANELAFLFYNGISPYGEKFKPLIEEYGLLEHLDKDKLLNQSHLGIYDPSAFR